MNTNESKSQNLLTLIFAAFCLLAIIPPHAHAAKPTKPQQIQKERLVLMPLRLGEEDQQLQGAMEMALVKGLQQRYEVFFGEQVAKKAREIFHKESRNTAKKECDETRCLQGIAESFQAELLATANITKQAGGYFIALSIQNLFDNKVVESESVACKGCDAFQVVEKLKELSGVPAPAVPVAAAPAEPEAPRVTATDPDSTTWNEAQKGNSVDDYQVYLDAYPKGKYIAFAKAKLKKLKEAQQAAAEQQEQQAWDAAQQENSEASYGLYLKGYPNGRFAGFAKTRQNKLKNDLAAKGPAMVRIPGKNYELGKYEVTQKEWRDIMGNNPSSFSNCGDTCPVEQVSWDDIQTFLQKLNQKTGRQYRLPTEVEWEYACYGGSRTEYCGSSDINAVAWYTENSNSTTHPVGQKQANGYGLYDMSGNVWEWMQNWYDSSQKWGALRGGSWSSRSQGTRAASRISFDPAIRDGDGGFRLAKTLP